MVYTGLSERASEPEVSIIEDVQAGDRYIGSSDGLSVTRQALADQLERLQGFTAQNTSEELVCWGVRQMHDWTNHRRRKDDIAVAVMDVQEQFPPGAYAEVVMD